MPHLKTAGLLLTLVLALSACGRREVILPGERLQIRPEVASEVRTEIPTLVLPAAVRNENWTHVSGSSLHHITHPALGPSPRLAWSADIGRGASREGRITSQPVVAGGLIFTLDAGARVSAVTPAGQVAWAVDLTPEDEATLDGFGGGLAFADGGLFATTGFGEILALDPSNGAIRWRTGVDAAVRAAPTVSDGVVIAIARNDFAYGLDAETGDIIWRLQGVGQGAGLLGGSSAAIRGPLAVIPFQSGEILGVLTRNGRTVWNAAITGGRRGLVRSRISDVSGDPVIDVDIVYAANQSGLLVSLDRRSGTRNWTLLEGAYGPPLPIGNSVFIVSDNAELMRVEADSGDVLWRVQLPVWQNPRKRRNAITHYGPILAGGNLYVASGDGLLRAFDPVTGAARGSVAIPKGAASQPAIANGVLYVLSQDGRLLAFQ